MIYIRDKEYDRMLDELERVKDEITKEDYISMRKRLLNGLEKKQKNYNEYVESCIKFNLKPQPYDERGLEYGEIAEKRMREHLSKTFLGSLLLTTLCKIKIIRLLISFHHRPGKHKTSEEIKDEIDKLKRMNGLIL